MPIHCEGESYHNWTSTLGSTRRWFAPGPGARRFHQDSWSKHVVAGNRPIRGRQCDHIPGVVNHGRPGKPQLASHRIAGSDAGRTHHGTQAIYPTQAVSWQTGRFSRRSTVKLACPTGGLLENLFDDPTMHIREAIIATGVPVGQSFMIDSQLL